MALNAEIVTESGLFDLARESSQSDVLYQDAIRSFLATQGIAGTRVASDLTDEVRRTSEATAEGFGWFAALCRWLQGEEHTIVDEETQMVEMGAYWLTVPPAQGASAQIEVDSESENNLAASFKLAGIGGGPKFTIKVNEGIGATVSADSRIVLSAPGAIQTIAVTREGQRITTYPRLAYLDKDNLTWRLNAARPPCPAAEVLPSETRRYDVTSGDSMTATFEVTRGTSWEFGVDFKVENLGIEVNSTTSVSYQSDVKFTYDLPAGGCYLAAQYSDIPARLWSLEAARK